MSIRDEVQWFAERMEEQLAKPANEAKDHWSQCSNDYLLLRAMEELGELIHAHYEAPVNQQPDIFIREAADVANFMMMYADNAVKNRGK